MTRLRQGSGGQAAPIYGLTPAQADCARVIAAMTDFLGNSPTYAEIAAELGLTNRSRAHDLVHCLVERGWVERRFSKRRPLFKSWRALRLTRSPPPFDYGAIDITEAGQDYLEAAA